MMSPKDISYAVIGAGNGGLAMAGHLAYKGYPVNLYNRTEEKIKDLMEDPVITLSGAVEGEGKLKQVTSDIKEAISGVDIIMVTTPATAHYPLAKAMAPYLEEGQIIILNPGRTGGALEVYSTIRKHGCMKDVTVAEAQTFIYACRATGPKSAKIFSIKNEVSLAAIPAYMTEKVIELLSGAYPQFTPARDVMETSLNNFGAIFHPAPTLLNSGHIERCQPFEYYLEGITPSIGQMLEKLDSERIKVANALGIKAISAVEWLKDTYGASGNSIYEAIQNTEAYKGLTAPSGLKTRYIYEDIPCSLVPISSLAKVLGVETPAIDTIIKLANIMTGQNFIKNGRTAQKLGLANLSVSQIHEFASKGEVIQTATDQGGVA